MRIPTFLCWSLFLSGYAFAADAVGRCPAELARLVPPAAPSEAMIAFLRDQRSAQPQQNRADGVALWAAQGTRYGEIRAALANGASEDEPKHLRALLTELGVADLAVGEDLRLGFKNGVLDDLVVELPVPASQTGELVASPALQVAVAAVLALEGPPRQTIVKFRLGEKRKIVLFSVRYYDTFSPLGVSVNWLEASVVAGALVHGDEKALRSAELYHERRARAGERTDDGFVAELDRLSGWLALKPHRRAVEFLLRSRAHVAGYVQRCASLKPWWDQWRESRSAAAQAIWARAAAAPDDADATAAVVDAFRAAVAESSTHQIEALAQWAPMNRGDFWALLRESATMRAFHRDLIAPHVLRYLPARLLGLEASRRGSEWADFLKAWNKTASELETRWLSEQTADERELGRIRTFVWERETIYPLQAAVLRMLWIDRYPETIAGIERGTLDYLPSGGRLAWIQTLRQVVQAQGLSRRLSAYGALLRTAENGDGDSLRELRALAEEPRWLPPIGEDYRERTRQVLGASSR